MRLNQYDNELQKAQSYFNRAVSEVDDKEMFDENIKDLLRYLHSYNFSINDVLGFYSLSDLQDEFDISRLMEYLHVSDKPNEQNSLAHNEYGFLVLINDEDEI